MHESMQVSLLLGRKQREVCSLFSFVFIGFLEGLYPENLLCLQEGMANQNSVNY